MAKESDWSKEESKESRNGPKEFDGTQGLIKVIFEVNEERLDYSK